MKDYRLKENRREVFLDFYEYHLKYRAHPGAVYYAFPYIFDKLDMTMEQKLWFVFINGCSQNVVTTYVLYKQFPNLSDLDVKKFSNYFREHYDKLGWDTDRRYVKNKLEICIENYITNLNGESQETYFKGICNTESPYKNFKRIWHNIMEKFVYFGRLSTFSYTEYLKLAGINLDCNDLFLEDITGSKSHRNALCKVLGRDDLDWYKDNEVKYDDITIDWLKKEGEKLLNEAKDKISHEDISYFTLESTLCCYKSWFRVNRRYPNVYNDMFYDRIKRAERLWTDMDYSIFWDARAKYLPRHLRLEDNPLDKGLHKTKQNHFRLTGEVIMMENEGYKISNNSWTRNTILIIGECGVGKTWVMKQLLDERNKPYKLGMFLFHETDKYIVIGKYDNSVFEGSDKLSMAIMRDLPKILQYINKKNKIGIFEGDRFTNSKFIDKAEPLIVRIKGDGKLGREKRGSNQTERHLKSIKTRVGNINSHKEVLNSKECLEYLNTIL